VKALRSLLVDLYPANLRSEGLRAALQDLVLPFEARGTSVRLDIDECPLPEEIERLVYRAAREALRNAHDHARASEVTVGVTRRERSVVLQVSDNGRGFDEATRESRRAEGHVGLDLLERLVHDVGGRFTLVTRPGEGTRLTVEVPAW
jgi:signal transduction histidine kinase